MTASARGCSSDRWVVSQFEIRWLLPIRTIISRRGSDPRPARRSFLAGRADVGAEPFNRLRRRGDRAAEHIERQAKPLKRFDISLRRVQRPMNEGCDDFAAILNPLPGCVRCRYEQHASARVCYARAICLSENEVQSGVDADAFEAHRDIARPNCELTPLCLCRGKGFLKGFDGIHVAAQFAFHPTVGLSPNAALKSRNLFVQGGKVVRVVGEEACDCAPRWRVWNDGGLSREFGSANDVLPLACRLSRDVLGNVVH